MMRLPSFAAAALAAMLIALCLAPQAWAQEPTASPDTDTRSDAPDTRPRTAKARPSDEAAPDDAPTPPKLRIKHSRRKPSAANTQPAWDALAAGDLAQARSQYERVLANEPRHLDALLGLAHIALAQNQRMLAQSLVQRALDAHPRHGQALALNLMLRSEADPLAAQSALKNLLATQGGIAHAHFAIGNLLARELRWQEAADAFLSAWSIEPDNADYQYNLAVSLDHLNQPALALDHYRGAQQAARVRRAAFDDAQAASRIRTLSEPASPGQPDRPK